MARTLVMTGAGDGICKATADLCRAAGDRVIGVDLKGTEVIADLSTPEGRASMVEQVAALAPDGIDGVLAGAGIGRPEPRTVAVNFHGAVATLEGLRPLLARSARARAVAICSTSALLPGNGAVVKACLEGSEEDALAAAAAASVDGYNVYGDSKKALTLWLRAAATRPEWAGAGILLNGVAPGVVHTPMTEPLFKDPVMVAAVQRSNPVVTKDYAQPIEIAEVIRFMLTMETSYLLGQVLFVDGGTDALMRPSQF